MKDKQNKTNCRNCCNCCVSPNYLLRGCVSDDDDLRTFQKWCQFFVVDGGPRRYQIGAGTSKRQVALQGFSGKHILILRFTFLFRSNQPKFMTVIFGIDQSKNQVAHCFLFSRLESNFLVFFFEHRIHVNTTTQVNPSSRILLVHISFAKERIRVNPTPKPLRSIHKMIPRCLKQRCVP